MKLFKKELQVGDKTFDDVVYVSTDTPTETAAFLANGDIQTTILLAVTDGGSIEIEGQQMTAKMPFGDAKTEDPALFRFRSGDHRVVSPVFTIIALPPMRWSSARFVASRATR